ncbi:CCA tRNA nucleotidyltransferase [Aneurinibacillus aneurinilyticus]|uniref:CCA tRNA nucleotidyltransferase n=2 Tax=Aneurinibacillus aneurinilyticus TaxID=1391 RepID=A0A848CUE8_ANEAE|nr:CCA tRNA nucleotidyltransferase [Aneurinibacillus aneurinilyticus]
MMPSHILEAGKQVLYVLEKAGYTAYFVGGYVRDTLLGRPVHDLDIATSARPDEVVALFARTIPTGLAHGTVTVLQDGVPLEVTTFRTEAGYADHRRPDEVRFVSDIAEDLARRDFTINAMALDLRGDVVDPFGGRQDLHDRIVRAVGKADERFAEDALRMLRCLRFASQLGFSIDPYTYEAIRRHAQDIHYVAVERISSEWNKALDGPYPERIVTGILHTGLASAMPGFCQLFEHKYDLTDKEQKQICAVNGVVPRWAYLFLICNRETEVETILRALRCEKKVIRACQQITNIARKLHNSHTAGERMRWILEHGFEALYEAASLYAIICENETTAKEIEQLYESMRIKVLQDLAVNGAELQTEMNRKGGPWIRDLLLTLALEVNEERIENERQALLLRARMILNEDT